MIYFLIKDKNDNTLSALCHYNKVSEPIVCKIFCFIFAGQITKQYNKKDLSIKSVILNQSLIFVKDLNYK